MKLKRFGRAAAVVLSAALIAAGASVAVPAELTPVKQVEAEGQGVSVTSAQIQGANVVVTVKASAVPASDDGMYHLLAQDPYQTGAQGVEVGKVNAAANTQFVFPLNKNTASSNLFKKFVVAMKQGGALTVVSNGPKFITNPEATAAHSVARANPSKKGILPSAQLLASGSKELDKLGVKQITYNLFIGDLCADGTIPYTYNGVTYKFNAGIVGSYDYLVPTYNAKGIQISMILLNNKKGDQTLIHPWSRGGKANYYAFNAADDAGTKKLEAVASFLADRYSGTGHGTIDNWIIGNEVNARADWHYMKNVECMNFANEYANSFRIFYNAIKAQNGNARIYLPIDQQWSRSANASKYYSSVDFLNCFNAIVSTTGNIDWHCAIHPYDVPLTDPVAWSSKYATMASDTPYITMQNIGIMTDYLSQKAFLAPNGQVRSVLCSEVGYGSTKGEEIQAASVVYGFLQAVNNRHIDGFILSREQDDAAEIRQGLPLGLITQDGRHKLAWEFYQGIDGANAASYRNRAASIIGVQDIASILNGR